MHDSRWTQDAEVFELIEHFNQPEKKNDWWALTEAEYGTILKEMDRCRKDFVYAARNYFWITNKDLEDQLLTLNQGQELIYQKMLELKAKGRAQKIVIIKGRQLGCSTLIEALIAWRTIFFSNINALVVSYDRGHTADVLYPIMTTIYDRLPWWMKPEVASRRNDEGIHFATKDVNMRAENPGLNSRVFVKAANTTTAVGMGIRLSAVHVSEFAAYDEKTAKQIIDEEMRHALIDSIDTFAILESTAKGANKYAHKLWKQCVRLADEADWYPLFLPAFFESKRIKTPPPGWRIDKTEYRVREQIYAEWLRCDKRECGGYHVRYVKEEDRSGYSCPTCSIGILSPYTLTDEQVYFMENLRLNSARDDDAAKKLLQELCVSGNTRVSTDLGMVKISDSKESIYTETGSISGWHNNGMKPVVIMKTRWGRELVATEDHLVACADGLWVEMKNLVGKTILLSPPIFSKSEVDVAWRPAPCYESRIHIDPDWARFLGYFMGDGCFYGNRVVMACSAKDMDVVQNVGSLMERLIGARSIFTKKGGMVLVESNSIKWKEPLWELGALKQSISKHSGFKRKTRVPECIFQSPRRIIKEFISALFECDGHAYTNSPRTAFFCKENDFARDVQYLLLGFGVNAHISRVTKKGQAKYNGMNYQGSDMRLNAIASNIFHKEIGFIGARKKNGAVRPTGQNTQRHEMSDLVVSVEPHSKEMVYDMTVDIPEAVAVA